MAYKIVDGHSAAIGDNSVLKLLEAWNQSGRPLSLISTEVSSAPFQMRGPTQGIVR